MSYPEHESLETYSASCSCSQNLVKMDGQRSSSTLQEVGLTIFVGDAHRSSRVNARELLRDLSVSDRCRRSAGLARHLTERPLEFDVRGLATHLQCVERPSAIDIHVVSSRFDSRNTFSRSRPSQTGTRRGQRTSEEYPVRCGSVSRSNASPLRGGETGRPWTCR